MVSLIRWSAMFRDFNLSYVLVNETLLQMGSAALDICHVLAWLGLSDRKSAVSLSEYVLLVVYCG